MGGVAGGGCGGAVWGVAVPVSVSLGEGMGGSFPPVTGYLRGEDVLNGIAYDKAEDRLWVTGKLWPRVFRVVLIDPSAPPQPPPTTLPPEQTTAVGAAAPTTKAATPTTTPLPVRVVAANDGGGRQGGGGLWLGAATGAWAAVLRRLGCLEPLGDSSHPADAGPFVPGGQ